MTKQKVALVTDSTAFLPAEFLQEHRIHVIPMNMHWGEQNLLDNVDITPEQFYSRLGSSRELPTTSQPSAGKFVELFEEVSQTAESIVCLLLSSDLSGTMASAVAALDLVGDRLPIEIVDTRSASLGESLIVSAIARAAARGKDHAEVAELARTLSPQARVMFVVDTLEYLHKGGRIGGGKRFIGSVLNVKPILHLQDGKVEAHSSVRTKRKAVDAMVQVMREEMVGSSALHVAVAHAAALAEGQQLAERIQEEFSPVELLFSELSPVIGTHTGPGTLGIAFYDGAFLPEIG